MHAELEWELHGKYQGERASIQTNRLRIVFEPEQAFYNPGETIRVWAEIRRNTTESEPLSDASVEVTLSWYEALPGDEVAAPPAASGKILLAETEQTPGRYEAEIPAPLQEGIYRLTAVARVADEPAIQLEELVAVESV